jgi:hypothetical protein
MPTVQPAADHLPALTACSCQAGLNYGISRVCHGVCRLQVMLCANLAVLVGLLQLHHRAGLALLSYTPWLMLSRSLEAVVQGSVGAML